MRLFIFAWCLTFVLSVEAQDLPSQIKSSNEECTTHYVQKQSEDPAPSATLVTICAKTVEADATIKNPKSATGYNGKNGESSDNWQRDNSEKDLAAQKSMAESTAEIKDFTKTITGYTFWGLFISGSGLLMLGYTILQNKKTFAHIQRASSEELKPYFQVELMGIPEGATDETNEFSFVVKFKLKNIGGTPAYNLRNFRISRSECKTHLFDIDQDYIAVDKKLIMDSVRVIDPKTSADIVFTVGFRQIGGWIPDFEILRGVPLAMEWNNEAVNEYNFTLQYVFNDISAPKESNLVRLHEVAITPSPSIHDEPRKPIISMHRDEVISKRELAKENNQR